MVGPTNLKPRAFSALDSARASALSLATSLIERGWLTIGR